MCRIAAFPPRFPRQEALEILANFEARNTDGTGSAYVKDGSFVIDKWAKPFSTVIKRVPFLGHMPYDGWTIAHLRAASHGGNTKQNTHPFVVGPWAFIHNGIWNEYKAVRLALSNKIKPEGETDSEIAAHLWNEVGPKKFAKNIDFGGVFMGLNVNGELWVAKTSGELEIKAVGDRVLLASELARDKYDGTVDAFQGWYHFDSDGKYIKHKVCEDKKPSYYGGYTSSGFRPSKTVSVGLSDNSWRTERTYTNEVGWETEGCCG